MQYQQGQAQRSVGPRNQGVVHRVEQHADGEGVEQQAATSSRRVDLPQPFDSLEAHIRQVSTVVE